MTERTRRAPRQAEAERNDHALLEAAREVLAADGAHASVAAIAQRAGVGIGSLYRRYRSKEELFQRLAVLAVQQWNDAAERGLAALVTRAHDAGVLRPDVTAVDVSLLIEQLGRSPLLDQVRAQGRDDLVDDAVQARRRIITIALDGLRAEPGRTLPGEQPSLRLLTERWERPGLRS
jgi:AcrR family transcriptional regulator